MLFTYSSDPSAETNSSTFVNLSLCGWIFFLPDAFLFFAAFLSTPTSLYVIIVWLEWKLPSVFELRHCTISCGTNSDWQLILTFVMFVLWVFMCLCICLFCTRERTFFLRSSLCVWGRYGLVETCHLPLSFDGSRLLISSGPISRPMHGASPPLITFPGFTQFLCQTPPLRGCHIHNKALIHPLFII